MSLCATRWAWNQYVSPSQKLVLLALAYGANDDDLCIATIGEICGASCLERKTVRSAIKRLENASLLEVKRIAGAASVYLILRSQGGNA